MTEPSAPNADSPALLSDFSRRLIANTIFNFLGRFGNGSRMKFAANLLVAIHNVSAAEAVILARKSGLDPAQAVQVLGDGAGASRMLQEIGRAHV